MIIAGGIVRNRDWILPRHSRAIRISSEVARNEAGAPWTYHYYVTGDNTDNTLEELSRAHVDYDLVCTGHPGFERKAGPTRYDSKNMSLLRNIWAHNAVERWPDLTHLWVVDSDVLPARDCLKLLLEADKPIIGAWVPHCTPAEGWAVVQPTQEDLDNGRNGFQFASRTGRERFHTEPFRATMLGGCYLIRRDAWNAGVCWAAHAQGEDGGFGDSARELGVEMWAHPLAKCEHIMEKPNEQV